jgi:hypothetical protein
MTSRTLEIAIDHTIEAERADVIEQGEPQQ